MKIIADEKKVKKYRRIASGFIYATFAFLGIGIILTFNQDTAQFLTPYFITLFLALLSSQVGVYLNNRYGGNPRQDKILSAALKGLDDRYYLYHFNAGVPHLLISPAGILVLIAYPQGGVITYDEAKGRWKQSKASGFMRFLGREGIGRPDLDARDYISDASKFLQRQFKNELPVPIQAVLVFTNKDVDVQAQNAPVPTMQMDKLKDYIRRKGKEENIADKVLQPLIDVLPEASNE